MHAHVHSELVNCMLDTDNVILIVSFQWHIISERQNGFSLEPILYAIRINKLIYSYCPLHQNLWQ